MRKDLAAALIFTLPFAAFAEPPRKDFRKIGTRSRVVVMGVRGLDAETLKEAQPAPGEWEKLAGFGAPLSTLDSFVRAPGAELKPVLVLWRGDGTQDGLAALETRMGQELGEKLLGAAPLVGDAKIQKYVNRVGTWVASQSDRPGLPWRFGVINSPSLNAFAVPGGGVFVTLGLYQRLGSEAELAAVLAHEIAHVTERHHLKAMLQAQALQVAAEKMKHVKFASQAINTLLAKASTKGCEVFARALEQDKELAADRMAVLMVADAGYDPSGLAKVMEILEQEAAAKKEELILKTHPSPESRLRELKGLNGSRVGALTGRPTLADRFKGFALR